MSEKDTVSSQDIPAFARALGTLALAAATAVAIKWFVSHDTKEKKAEGNEDDLQNNPRSTVQEEKTIYDDSLDGIPLRIQPQVSDGCGKNCNLLLEGGPAETSCTSQSTINDEDNGQQIDLSCGISPKKADQVTSDNCTLNKVVTLTDNSALLIQSEDGSNASTLTANNATEDPMVFGSLTHRRDILSFERSSSFHEPESTSSSYGQCIDDLNTRCSGQYQLNVQDIPAAGEFVQHSHVSKSLNRYSLINRLNEENGILNPYSEINVIKNTTSAEEQKCNIDNPVIDCNDEDDTLITGIGNSGRNNNQILCNTVSFEAELSTKNNACIPNCHNVPVISDNAAQFTLASEIQYDTLQCTGVQSPVEKALSAAHDNVVSVDDICKDINDVTLSSSIDFRGSNINQSDTLQDHTLKNGTVIEIPNEESKNTFQDAVQDIIDGDDDTTSMVSSFENDLPNNGSSDSQQFLACMDAYTGRYEEHLQSTSHCGAVIPKEGNMTDNSHCNPNNTKMLPLSEKCNYAENTAFMYPLNFDDPHAPFKSQAEQNEHQINVGEIPVALINMGTSNDLSKSLLSEQCHKDIDINKECVGLYSSTSDAAHTITTLENIMIGSTSFGTANKMVVNESEFNSDVRSLRYEKDNIEFQNGHTCKDGKLECNNITNGFLEINHGYNENNGPSKSIQTQEHCSEDLMSAISEASAFPIGDICLENTYICKDRDVSAESAAVMGIYNTAQIQQHNANGENDIFQESVGIGWDKQLSDEGDTSCSCTNPLAKDMQNQPMCCDPNIGSAQNQYMCLKCNNVHNVPSKDSEEVINSRENIMSTIAENPELILPEYQSKFRLVKKRPLMTKSCDNILSGHSLQEPTLKTKAQSMLCLLTEYYSSKMPSENGPVEKVARGSFICIPKGLQNFGEAMRFQLTLGNCLDILKLARKKSVPELLKAVYTVISDNYLNVLKNSAVYGQLTGLEREKILELRMMGKVSLCVVETKSIFGLNKYIKFPVETAKCKAQLYSLHSETNQWKPLTSIPEEACLKGCSICSMHNYLFIAGGLRETAEGLTCSNKLFCYNPLTDIWTQLSPMNEGRSQLKLIPLDGYLYAIGGECLHTVEKYDPRLNKWTFVAPLPKGTFAVAHEAAACGGEIYISGGHLFYRLLKYSPVHDQWEECPFNASKGRSCDMVAVGGILYRFDMHKDSTVNILKYNTMAKMWSEYTADFQGSKIPFRCVLFEGNIYCINRETTAKFSLDDEKVCFEAGVFSKVPTRGEGSPHPTVLYLRDSVSQTSV